MQLVHSPYGDISWEGTIWYGFACLLVHLSVQIGMGMGDCAQAK